MLEAGNGIEALQKCEAAMPGLILLDLMMPVMDGFAFLEELRHRPGGGNVPVLVVTARDLSDEERRRLNRSLAQVLARESLTREQLLDRIREQMPRQMRAVSCQPSAVSQTGAHGSAPAWLTADS